MVHLQLEINRPTHIKLLDLHNDKRMYEDEELLCSIKDNEMIGFDNEMIKEHNQFKSLLRDL